MRGILKSINTKNKLYKKLRQTSTKNLGAYEYLNVRFNRYRNILKQVLMRQKEFFSEYLCKI